MIDKDDYAPKPKQEGQATHAASFRRAGREDDDLSSCATDSAIQILVNTQTCLRVEMMSKTMKGNVCGPQTQRKHGHAEVVWTCSQMDTPYRRERRCGGTRENGQLWLEGQFCASISANVSTFGKPTAQARRFLLWKSTVISFRTLGTLQRLNIGMHVSGFTVGGK